MSEIRHMIVKHCESIENRISEIEIGFDRVDERMKSMEKKQVELSYFFCLQCNVTSTFRHEPIFKHEGYLLSIQNMNNKSS